MIVVIGAGPVGLSAAWQLTKLGKKVIVFDKADTLGGLAATFSYKDFKFDFGPHVFHLNNPKIIAIIKSLLGPDFRVIPTQTHILLRGKLYNFPLKVTNALFKLPLLLSFRILSDYGYILIRNKILPIKDDNFKSWGIKRFGKTLYDVCFGKYTEKIWGMPAEKISPKLGQQKVQGLNLKEILKRIFFGQKKEHPVYFKKSMYPSEGIGLLYNQFAKEIKKQGGEIKLNCPVTKIKIQNQKAKSVVYQDQNEKEKELHCEGIISTITLSNLVEMIRPLDPATIQAGKKLRYRDMIIVFLIINQDFVTRSQWVYLADDCFRFNRFTEQKNLGPKMIPKDKTVLGFEICCQKDDGLWQSPDETLYKIALEELKKIAIVDIKKVQGYFVRRKTGAYPIYDLNFEKQVQKTLNGLAEFKNMIVTGRNGLFLNIDIHDSIEMGLISANYLAQSPNNNSNWYKIVQKYIKKKIEVNQ